MTEAPPPFLATDPDAYEHFMGRWSSKLSAPFLEFAGTRPNEKVLDLGCGTGVMTLALARLSAKAIGVDASEPYLDGARRLRPHPDLIYEAGDARHLQYPDGEFDSCISTLVLDVIPETRKVAAEMRRVTRPGGIVVCAVFDFWGGVSARDLVLDTASVLDEGMRILRDQLKGRPLLWADGQARLWRETGLTDVVEIPIVLGFDYASFEDYWSSFSTGPSSVAQRLMAMPAGTRAETERHVRAAYLAGLADGPRSFAMIVRTVRGIVPH
jgi:SAM-dependent methyltransferase